MDSHTDTVELDRTVKVALIRNNLYSFANLFYHVLQSNSLRLKDFANYLTMGRLSKREITFNQLRQSP